MTPDQEDAAFLYYVGHALTQWAHVEYDMMCVGLACCHEDAGGSLARAYYTIDSFKARMLMVDGLVQGSEASPASVAAWEVLRRRIDKLASRRNQLAHRSVVHNGSAAPGRRMGLVRFLLATPGTPGQLPEGSIFLKDVIQFHQEAHIASIELQNLCQAFRGLGPIMTTLPTTSSPTIEQVCSRFERIWNARK